MAGKPIIGIGSTSGGLGGFVPQVNRTGYTSLRERKLFYSQREVGLLVPKTIRGGYGELPMGTVMAEDVTSGFLVPYIPDTIGDLDLGRIFLVTGCNAANTFQIWAEDSAKIKATDVIILTDTDGTYEQATVTSVVKYDDRRYTVTLSANTTGNFEIGAKKANCYLKAGTTGKYSVAKFLLDQDTYAGDYTNASGALSSVFLSNGIVYTNACTGLDTTAATALGATIDGPLAYFK